MTKKGTRHKTKPQETRNTGEPASQETKRPWVTPAFERVPLKEALGGMFPGIDMQGQQNVS